MIVTAWAYSLACVLHKPKPPLAGPKPWLSGQARPYPSLAVRAGWLSALKHQSCRTGWVMHQSI